MRNRLVGAVAVVAAAVLGAAAPGLLDAADNAHDSQQLVDLAELNARAITLAHSLADERDAMTAYVAAGRGSGGSGTGTGDSRPQRARVDRQIGELRSEAQDSSGDTAVYQAAAKLLRALPQTRHKALSGTDAADHLYTAYTEIIQALGAIGTDIARGLPARADSEDAGTRALPVLGRATEQAAGTRALLLAALDQKGSPSRLTRLAQVTYLREQGALGEFRQIASPGARDRYDRTVTGSDVNAAERHLTSLTDQPRLDTADFRLDRQRVQSALTTRIGLMRGVESAMATADIERLGGLRDDEVTELEIRIGLAGLCLLLAVGAGIWAARTMTQPLAALRLGAQRLAADPADEEPLTYKGRNDEFAATVRSVNALHAKVGELARRTAELEGERARLAGGRQRLTAEREVLQEQSKALQAQVAGLTERLARAHTGVHGRFAHLSLRTLGLVEQQLAVIESLEEDERDPERLATLYRLDHFAARIRRHSENLLVLAGTEQHSTHHQEPVPLLDVLRAAVSEIERYERVRMRSLPPHTQVAGFAADDLSHLVAELLDNATAFSPPDAHVELSGWLRESGEVVLSVQDEGIGMTAERMAEINERLSDAEAASSSEDADEALGLGLYVVVRLAARHGIRVELREAKQGGVTAEVVLSGTILPSRPAPSSAPASSPSADSARLAPSALADTATATTATGGSGEHVRTGDDASPAAGPRPKDTDTTAPAAATPSDPYAIGPDQHTRPGAEAARTAAAAGASPDEQPRTALGLPKRKPRIVARQRPTPAVTRKSGASHAEALRRRLGGFQQGARDGRREAEAELAERTEPLAERTAESTARQTGQVNQTNHTNRTNEVNRTNQVNRTIQTNHQQQTIPQTETDGAGAPGERHSVEEARD
ncbi:nitrate- and nitrite sensing domain-containing protein [Streptomyces sp. NPDC001339]|uniref:nitrate- and nitrite sensing domain-containing protein n=1 Tax=Streptomyces sp. NPDC001339 TaxID=3364563 RepID=UPI003679618A